MAEPIDPTLPALTAAAPDPGRHLPERYEDRGWVGSGAMGEVRRVYDRHLGAERAMKVQRFAAVGDATRSRRFVDEARLQARLSHPGIVSVYEMGALPDGRQWFTMDLVRGQTLAEAWEGGGLPLNRFVDVLRRVALAVAYAHGEGVVHRDLKPANLMLGPFGEVIVMDWGISRIGRELEPSPDSEGDAADATRHGQVLGTPAYMPPEQARGQVDRVGAKSDVYALGAMLYEGLSGRRPYRGLQPLVALLEGPPPSLRSLAPSPLPEALVSLCEAAMTRDEPDARPSAAAFAERLQAWLEGAERRERALAIVTRAEAARPAAEALRAEADALHGQAMAALDAVPPSAPVAAKREAWALEVRAGDASRQALRAELDAREHARSALELVPGLAEAHALLADLYRDRLLRAEAEGDQAAAEEAEAMLRRHDRGAHAELLVGDGWLDLVTEPAGATVRAWRLEEVDRRLVEAPTPVDLGTTPLRDVRLPRGSWVLTLEHPDTETVRYPVALSRGGRWRAASPGAQEPTPVRLPPRGAVPPEGCFVAAGWFVVGGDPLAPDGIPRRWLWADAFVCARQPVTNAEYLAFLDDLVARGDATEAARRVPRTHHADGEGKPIWPRGPDGRYRLATCADALTQGRAWSAADPVTLVAVEDAHAYAAWLAARTGRPWRLLHGMEWEKAARGVDGRCFPWGDHFEPTWCRMGTSDPDGSGQVEVHAYPDDVSVYGVRGMAGNVRDLCWNGYLRQGLPDGVERVPPPGPPGDSPWRVVRGGCWFSAPDHTRVALRAATRPGERRVAVGFRVGFSW